MKKLYTARDAMEAHFLRQLLQQEGIPAEVLGENLSIARGELPLTAETLPSVWVRSEHAERAVRVVAQMLSQASGGDAAGDPWTCPGCGEAIEGQFDICWNCQTPRPEDDKDPST
jgi:hypothetical protein